MVSIVCLAGALVVCWNFMRESEVSSLTIYFYYVLNNIQLINSCPVTLAQKRCLFLPKKMFSKKFFSYSKTV